MAKSRSTPGRPGRYEGSRRRSAVLRIDAQHLGHRRAGLLHLSERAIQTSQMQVRGNIVGLSFDEFVEDVERLPAATLMHQRVSEHCQIVDRIKRV